MKKFVLALAILLSATSAFTQTSEHELSMYYMDHPSIVHVNRTAPPEYPKLVLAPVDKSLDLTGPSDYDLDSGDIFLGYEADPKNITGDVIYARLKESKLIESCLGLADALAIQAKGAGFFRDFFGNQNIFFWKSVAWFPDGSKAVPYLFENKGTVYVNWRKLDSKWDGHSPSLHVSQSP
jgi:hypothetical protein